MIRKLFLILPLAVFFSACSENKTEVSTTLNLTMLEGEAFDTASAPIFLLNYWATWCKPCLEEMPELNDFAKSQTAPLLGLNYDVLTSDLSSEEQQEQADKLQIEFAVLDALSIRALEQDWQLPRPNGLPTTYLLSSTGIVLATLQGPQTLVSLKQAVIQARERQSPGEEM